MKTKRPHRDQRYRDKCFPGAEKEVFSPKGGGYAPLPYISRELLRHMKGAELKVWVYMLTREGPHHICYPTYEDIMREPVSIRRARSVRPSTVWRKLAYSRFTTTTARGA